MEPKPTPEEAWAGYRKYKEEFERAGIPWNKKGSPHRLLLKAKWYLRHIPLRDMIAFTLRHYTLQLVANIANNNALLQRLKKNHG